MHAKPNAETKSRDSVCTMAKASLLKRTCIRYKWHLCYDITHTLYSCFLEENSVWSRDQIALMHFASTSTLLPRPFCTKLLLLQCLPPVPLLNFWNGHSQSFVLPLRKGSLTRWNVLANLQSRYVSNICWLSFINRSVIWRSRSLSTTTTLLQLKGRIHHQRNDHQ